MKSAFFIMVIFLICNAFLIGSNQQLSPIDSLKELPVKLIVDFMKHDGIASYARPVITKEGDIFFYDRKLNQIFKTSIHNPILISIGREGEGPQEYSFVYDLFLHQDLLYIYEMKQKLLCFGINGEYKWETRTGFQANKIVGKKGDTFYFSGTSKISDKKIYSGLYTWEKGKKQKLMIEYPGVYQPMKAFINGKITNSGFGPVAVPVYCFAEEKDIILTAASTEYCFNIMDNKGDLQKTISIDAPLPEINEIVKSFKPPFKKNTYAIMDIFYQSPYIVVLSNYFKNRKQRIDFFTMDGKIEKSFLLPFQAQAREKKQTGGRIFISVSNGYLLFTDDQEVGFKVYRSPEF